MSWRIQVLPVSTRVWLGMAVAISGGVGVFAGLVLEDTRWMGLPIALATGVIMVLMRGYFQARESERQIQALYDTSRALLDATRLEDAVESLLRRTHTLFHSETADFLLFSGAGVRSFSVGDEGAMSVRSRSPSPTELEAVYAIGDREVVLADRRENRSLRRLLSEAWNADSGLVATIRSGHEPALLILHPRPNSHHPYGPVELKTLSTLVTQVSTVLDRTRLLDAVGRMQEIQATLQHRAEHDPLTGLANRTRLLDRIDEALASEGGDGVAVVFVDIDHFKPINDTHGHTVGDVVLQTVARRLRACLREHDLAARLGGDEFAVMLDGAADQAVRDVAARIEASLEEPIVAGGILLEVRASIGVATAARGDLDPQRLLKAADEAMYRAKRATRTRLGPPPHTTSRASTGDAAGHPG